MAMCAVAGSLGVFLLPNNAGNTLPTIGEMVATGKRALVTFQYDDYAAKTSFLWPGYGALLCSWCWLCVCLCAPSVWVCMFVYMCVRVSVCGCGCGCGCGCVYVLPTC